MSCICGGVCCVRIYILTMQEMYVLPRVYNTLAPWHVRIIHSWFYYTNILIITVHLHLCVYVFTRWYFPTFPLCYYWDWLKQCILIHQADWLLYVLNFITYHCYYVIMYSTLNLMLLFTYLCYVVPKPSTTCYTWVVSFNV